MRFVADLNEAKWSGTAEARRALCDGPAKSSSIAADDIMAAEALDTDAEAQSEVLNIEAESGMDRQSSGEMQGESDGKTMRFGTPRDLSILFIHAPPSSLKDAARIAAFIRNVRNLPKVEVMQIDEVEVYHVLKYQWCVMETGVLEGIEASANEAVVVEEEDVLGEAEMLDGVDMSVPPAASTPSAVL